MLQSSKANVSANSNCSMADWAVMLDVTLDLKRDRGLSDGSKNTVGRELQTPTPI